MSKDELHLLVQRMITNEDPLCYDVAALAGQHFDNVKHMTWFRQDMMRELERSQNDNRRTTVPAASGG